MSGREEQLLTSSIKDTIHLAGKAETAFGELVKGFGSRANDEHLPELAEAEDDLRWYVTKLYRDIDILAERMNLPIFARQMRREFTSMKTSELVEMDQDPTMHGIYSIELGELRGYFASLSTMTSAGAVTGLHVFQTILGIWRSSSASPGSMRTMNPVQETSYLKFCDTRSATRKGKSPRLRSSKSTSLT